MSETKYGKYVFKHPVEIVESRECIQFEGDRDFGTNLSITYLPITEPEVLEESPHSHDFDMYYTFIGLHANCLEDLGAEIEMSLGEEREKHVISNPTVVTVPAGVYHCPHNFARIGKPIYCLEAFLTSKYEGTNL